MAAYTDAATGALEASFNQAIGIYLWAWFIVTVVFTIAAMRSSWVLFIDLFLLDICLLLLACGYMVNTNSLLTAGYAFGLCVSFLSCESKNHQICYGNQSKKEKTDDNYPDWAGCAGLWGGGTTPIQLPTFEMSSSV